MYKLQVLSEFIFNILILLIMKKKELSKVNDMLLIDRMTNTEVNQVKGGKWKVEGTLSFKISNEK